MIKWFDDKFSITDLISAQALAGNKLVRIHKGW